MHHLVLLQTRFHSCGSVGLLTLMLGLEERRYGRYSRAGDNDGADLESAFDSGGAG